MVVSQGGAAVLRYLASRIGPDDAPPPAPQPTAAAARTASPPSSYVPDRSRAAAAASSYPREGQYPAARSASYDDDDRSGSGGAPGPSYSRRGVSSAGSAMAGDGRDSLSRFVEDRDPVPPRRPVMSASGRDGMRYDAPQPTAASSGVRPDVEAEALRRELVRLEADLAAGGMSNLKQQAVCALR